MIKLPLITSIALLLFFCGIQKAEAKHKVPVCYTITANETAYFPSSSVPQYTLSPCTTYDFVYQLSTTSTSAVTDNVTINLPAGISYVSLTPPGSGPSVVNVSGGTSPVFTVSAWDNTAPASFTVTVTTPSICVQASGLTTITGSNSCNTYSASSSLHIEPPVLHAINTAGSSSLLLNIGDVNELVFSLENASSNGAGIPNIDITSITADPTVTLYGDYYLSTSPTPLTGNFYTYSYPTPVAGSISANSPITSGSIHIGSSDFTYFFGSSVFPAQPQELYVHIPYKVIDCGLGGGTYIASWGCGSTSCTSIPLTSSINVQTGTPHMAVVGYPAFQNGSYCGPGSNSSVIGFIYKNTGTPIGSPAPAGNARATDLQLYLYSQASFGTLDLNSFQVASGINTLTLSAPVVSSAGTFYFGADLYDAYLVDFSQLSAGLVGWNPLGTGNTLADLDADGKVNDLAEAGTFTITATYNYNTTSCPEFDACGGSFKNLPYIISRYNNQCYSLPPMPTTPTGYGDASYYYHASGSGGSINGPADVVEGAPFSVEICTAPYTQRWGPTGFDFDCPNGYHQIKVNLPLGYHLDFSSLTSIGSGIYNLPNVVANGRCGGTQTITPTVQEICGANPLDPSYVIINFGKILYSNCGPWNETYVLDCFNLPLYLDCSGTAAACATVPLNFGADNISFALQYICDQSCATCVSDIECGGSSIYHHCSGSCDSYFSTATNSFSFKRTTLGWTNPGATSACGTPLSALTESTDPPIDLEAAYPGDVIEAKLQGSFTGTLSTPAPVYNGSSFSTMGLQIRYDDLPAGVRASPYLFDFDQQNGYITITNSVTTASITVLSSTITYVPVVNGSVVEMNFWLPASAQTFMSSSTDTYVFDADLFLVARATPAVGAGTTFYAGHASFPLTDLRAEYIGQRPGSPLPAPDVSCDSWGTHFTMIQPSTNVGYYPDVSYNNVSTCEPYPVMFMFQSANGRYGSADDDFPYEFRPYAGLDPQVTITLPPGYQYISSTFNIMQSASSSAPGSHNAFASSPPPITFNPYPISGEVVTSSSSGTTIQYNGLSASNTCWPLLDGKYNAYVPFYTITVLMQPTCTAPASDHFEFAGGYTEGIQQSDPAYQVHTNFNLTNLPVYHINPTLSVVPSATSVSVYSNQADFEFTICDGIPANGNHPWIAIENSLLNSLDLSTAVVQQTAPTTATLTTVPYTDGNGNTGILVSTANIPAGQCIELLLSATVNSNGCVPTGNPPALDQLTVRYGNECAGNIITSPDEVCEQGSVLFQFERYPSDLQLFQALVPSAPVDLCDGTLQYELIVSSSDIGTITNPSLLIDLPTGISVTGLAFEYPIGGPSVTVSTPDAYDVNGDPIWNIYSHVTLPGGNGLTGVTTAPANQVKVYVTLQTSCTYNVTDYINFYAEGISSCSQQLTTLPVQHRPTINNALPIDELNVQVTMSTSDMAAGLNCSNTATFTVTVNNTGAQANLHNETVTVTVPGSPLVLSNTGSAVVSGSTLTWIIPTGTLAASSSITFTFDLSLANSVYCETHLPVAAVVGYTELVNCEESGGHCNVGFSSEPDSLFIDACCPCILELGANHTICSGQGVSLDATTSGAIGYSWAPATGLSCTNCANPTASPTVTTTYTATVTTATGSCSDNVTISVNPLPSINVNSPAICYRQMAATLIASGASTYTWTPAGTLSPTTGATVTATPSTTIVYTVTGTDANGCISSATSTVTVNALPVITVNSASVCGITPTTLIAGGALTYTWTPAISVSPTTGATVTATPMATTIYTVTGTDANGCYSSATSTVTVNPFPVVTVNSPSVCIGSSVNLNASGASTYSWTPSTGLSATTGTTVSATPTVTTVYTVTGTNAFGCSSSASSTVTVNALPNVTVNSAGFCSDEGVTLTANGANTYTWLPPTGLSATTGSVVTAAPSSTTIYTVTGTAVNGCTATATSTVTVVSPPVLTVTPSLTICIGASASLSASGASGYQWNRLLPTPVTYLASTPGITVTPTVTTVYQVIGSTNPVVDVCATIATVTVTVLDPIPVITGTTSINCGQSVTLNASAVTPSTTFSWQPVNTTGPSMTDYPSVTTVYTVTGTAGACTATSYYTVTVNAVGSPLWPKHPDSGSNGTDEVTDVVQDGSGNTFVVGNFTGTLIAGGITVSSPSSTSSCFVAKFSDCGTEWVRSFTSNAPTGSLVIPHTYGRAITLDNNGDVIITGGFYGNNMSLTPMQSGYMVTSLSAGAHTAAYVIRLNGNTGNTMDAIRSTNDAPVTEGTGIVFKSPYVYVSGHSNGQLTISPVNVAIPANDRDIFVTKLNTSGLTAVWLKKFGFASTSVPKWEGTETEVGVDASNNVYVGGTIYGQINFGIPSASYGNGSGKMTGLIVSYNSSGAERFGNAFHNTTDDIYLNDLACDANGNCYVTGSWKGTIQGGSSSASTRDVFQARVNHSGTALNLSWNKKASGTGVDEGSGVALDNAGNVYFTGKVTPGGTFEGMSSISTGMSSGGEAFVCQRNASTGAGGTYAVASSTSPSAATHIVQGKAVSANSNGSSVVFGGSYVIASAASVTFNSAITTTLANAPEFFAARTNLSGAFFRQMNGEEELPFVKEGLQLYPNPNNGTFTLQFAGRILNASNVEVYDGQGKKVEVVTKAISDEQLELSLQNVAQGIYMVVVQEEGEVYSKRVVINW
jgi:hypothetical protein